MKASHHCRGGSMTSVPNGRPQYRGRRQCTRFHISPREFTTRVGGLFLFVHDLVRFGADAALALGAKYPALHDPAGMPCALRSRSSYGPSNARAISWRSCRRRARAVLRLNAMPKKTFCLSIHRASPAEVSRLLDLWHNRVTGEISSAQSLNLTSTRALYRRASDRRSHIYPSAAVASPASYLLPSDSQGLLFNATSQAGGRGDLASSLTQSSSHSLHQLHLTSSSAHTFIPSRSTLPIMHL